MNDRGRIIINCSADDLIQDIRVTHDPIKKIMLKKFLAIKMYQSRAESDDPSLDDLSNNNVSYESDNESDNESNNNNSNNNDNDIIDQTNKRTNNRLNNKLNNNMSVSAAKQELDKILKQQKTGLNELDKITKIKTYIDMIEDNKRDADRNEIKKTRGKNEEAWESKEIYDPRYVKYQKEDVMNNKLMERLNSEIDFRTDPDSHGRVRIEKPFDDGEPENTEQFARYVPPNDENVKYVPKSRGRDQLGLKRPIRR